MSADFLLPSVRSLATELSAGSTGIPLQRRNELRSLAAIVGEHLAREDRARLTFICTHNSRRSHLSQVLAQLAAAFHGVNDVECFSGGTEATACNPRTIAAFERAGFEVTDTSGGENPIYEIRFAKDAMIRAWSKVYNEDGNPESGYIGVMTCTHADENCSIVHGASERFSLPFVDPKEADDTPEEAATYDERLRQIGSQMFFLMEAVSEQID